MLFIEYMITKLFRNGRNIKISCIKNLNHSIIIKILKKNFIAKEIYQSLIDKGYNIKFLRYEDHTNIGSFMEHRFMPFIADNPDRKYEIFITNEH